MADWSVEVRGDEDAERRLGQLAVLLRDLRSFWPKVVPLFVGWMREQFGSEGAWGGAPWAPLSPGYALWKAGRYPGRGILYATGQLRRAASSPQRTATADSLTLRIVDAKAGWHQDGTTKMPARPIVPSSLPITARIQLDRAADNYVDDLVRRLGL